MDPTEPAKTAPTAELPYIHWTRKDGVRFARAAGYLLLAYPDGRWSMTGPSGGKVARAPTQKDGEEAAVAALTEAMAAPVTGPVR